MEYEKPKIEIVAFRIQDVITSSPTQNGSGDDWDVSNIDNY